MPGKKGGGGGKPKAGPTNGDDFIMGTKRDDVIDALGGDDKVIGGDGDDIIFGGEGDDELFGGRGDDELYGGAGDDFLTANTGAGQIVDGGADYDIAAFNNLPPSATVGGVDIGYTFTATATEGGYVTETATLSNIEEIWGSNHNDTFYGGAFRDVFDGRLGDDEMHGGGGNDRLFGSLGNDTATGGAGADEFVFHRHASFDGDGAVVATYGDGLDTVTDYEAGDVIVITTEDPGYAPGDVILDLVAGEGTYLTYSGDGSTVLLEGYFGAVTILVEPFDPLA